MPVSISGILTGMSSSLIISFDLDGVLIENPFGKGVFPWVREHVRGTATALAHLDRDEQDALMTATVNEEWVARMMAGDFVGAYDWDSILNVASQKLGGPDVPDITALVERFCLEDGMIALLPGAREGLELLREQGATVYALTNGYRYFQLPALEALGIAEFFTELVTPEVTGAAKPQPGMFTAVPGLSIHVGDMLVHDIYGAREAGLRTVWLNPGLPDELLSLPLASRTEFPGIDGVIEAELAATPYARVHPEVNAQNSRPDFVVRDALEAAQAALL